MIGTSSYRPQAKVFAFLALLSTLLAGCGGGDDTGLTVPRGATVAVRLDESLASTTNKPGDRFRASLSTPLQQGGTTYVPLDAEAEGIVVESVITDETDPRARLSIRLTGLRLPNGELIELETVPVVRESGFDYRNDEIELTTGLDVDLDSLLGREAFEAPEEFETEMLVEIPVNSPLVFTLEEDVFVPAP